MPVALVGMGRDGTNHHRHHQTVMPGVRILWPRNMVVVPVVLAWHEGLVEDVVWSSAALKIYEVRDSKKLSSSRRKGKNNNFNV